MRGRREGEGQRPGGQHGAPVPATHARPGGARAQRCAPAAPRPTQAQRDPRTLPLVQDLVHERLADLAVEPGLLLRRNHARPAALPRRGLRGARALQRVRAPRDLDAPLRSDHERGRRRDRPEPDGADAASAGARPIASAGGRRPLPPPAATHDAAHANQRQPLRFVDENEGHGRSRTPVLYFATGR